MWHGIAKHCPRCGTPLEQAEVEGRARPRCPACAFVVFGNPASVAAGLVVDRVGQILLVRRAIEPCAGQWALPAGYQEIDEELPSTARREVREEAGVEVDVVQLLDLHYVAHVGRRPANVAFFLCRQIGGALKAGDDALGARWFPLAQLPAEMAFDNGVWIRQRLAALDWYALAFGADPSGKR